MLIRTTAERGKDLVKVIEEATGAKPKYLGPPSFAFEGEGVVIFKDGSLQVDKHEKEIMKMLENKALLPEENNVEITVPIDDFDSKQVMNLIFIMYSRQKLLNSSIGTEGFYIDDSLVEFLKEEKPDTVDKVVEQANRYEMMKGLRFDNGNVVFSGFPAQEIASYASLAAMIVSQARNSKRVIAKITDTQNEKYTARVWLNQLGLGGTGGKEVRGTFLRNLNGNSAFRTDESREKWSENRKKSKNVVS